MLLRLFVYCLPVLMVTGNRHADSFFAFVQVRNPVSGETGRFCVNHQHPQANPLPPSPDEAKPVRLSWLTPTFNDTDVCALEPSTFSEPVIVPIYYVTANPAATCLNATASSFMDGQLDYVKKHGAEKILFLVKKGEQVEVSFPHKKYLFAQFFNPQISLKSPDTFYIYHDDFFENLLPLSSGTHEQNTGLDLSFYRPKNAFVEPAQFIILAIAVGCISIGSFWAVRKFDEAQRSTLKLVVDTNSSSTAEEGALNVDSQSNTSSNSNPANAEGPKPNASLKEQLIGVAIGVILVVGVLLLAFYFRTVAVWIFNVFLAVVGTWSIHRCFTALLCFRDPQFGLSTIARRELPGALNKTIGVTSFFILLFAASICITWFVIRKEYYAFWFLDFINICLCINAIQVSQFRSLSIICFFLIGMFAYDIVMVFGTKYMTGCSVMIQVVTGMDCDAEPLGPRSYPIAPVEVNRPERMPLLFFVPILGDAMRDCYDIAVETEYRNVMLGLGDVIVPGYLIVYCFIVDQVKPTKLPYGVIVLIGYSLGLIATFAALYLMEIAQPALIYLVPFTLIPVLVASWIRGHLREIWYGKFKMV